MAKVFVASTVPPFNPALGHVYGDTERFLRCVAADRVKTHQHTLDAANADIVLFIGSKNPDLSDVLAHPLATQDRERCFIFHMGDRIVPRMPGVYTCLEAAWHHPGRTRAGHYTQVAEYSHCTPRDGSSPPGFLYTFLGRCATHPIRQRIATLNNPRGLVLDTSAASGASPVAPDQYAHAMCSGLFALCPRGIGSSSFRLFEAMRLGRAPVIISDAWVPPEGPQWSAFSVRIPESQIDSLPERLAALEREALTMGMLASKAYANWFAQDVTFHRVVEWCLAIQGDRRWPERLLRLGVTLRLCSPRRLLARIVGHGCG